MTYDGKHSAIIQKGNAKKPIIEIKSFINFIIVEGVLAADAKQFVEDNSTRAISPHRIRSISKSSPSSSR